MNTYISMKVKALFWTGTQEQKLYLRWGRKKHVNYNDLDRWQLRFNAKVDWFFFLKPKLVCVFSEPTSTRVNKNYSEVWTNNLPCLKSDVMYCLWRESSCDTACILRLLSQWYESHWLFWSWYSNLPHKKRNSPCSGKRKNKGQLLRNFLFDRRTNGQIEHNACPPRRVTLCALQS